MHIRLMNLTKMIDLTDSKYHLLQLSPIDSNKYIKDTIRITIKSCTCFWLYIPLFVLRIILFAAKITKTTPNKRANPAIDNINILKEEKKLFSSFSYLRWNLMNVEDIPKTKIDTKEVIESTVVFKP